MSQTEVRAAWTVLLKDADVIAQEVTSAHVRAGLLGDVADPAFALAVRRNNQAHIRLTVRALAGDGRAAESLTRLWSDTSRLRASQGVPKERMLRAYALGARILWEALIDRAGASPVPVSDGALLDAGRQLWQSLDRQSEYVHSAYHRVDSPPSDALEEQRAKVLDDLIEGRGADPAFAGRAREVLDIPADATVACVAGPCEATEHLPVDVPIERLSRHGVRSAWTRRSGSYVGLLAMTIEVAEVAHLLRPHVVGRVGMATCRDGVSDFATAHHLAALTAETLPARDPALAEATDRLPELLLASNSSAADLLVDKALGGILRNPPDLVDTLLSTLQVLLDHDGSPTRAAETLQCHRNTIIHRQRRLEELTGRSLTNAQDRLLMTLALRALEASSRSRG